MEQMSLYNILDLQPEVNAYIGWLIIFCACGLHKPTELRL